MGSNEYLGLEMVWTVFFILTVESDCSDQILFAVYLDLGFGSNLHLNCCKWSHLRFAICDRIRAHQLLSCFL